MANLKSIERHLTSQGWSRCVAGEADFNAALLAIETAVDNRLGLIVSGEYGVGKSHLAQAFLKAFGRFRKVRLGVPEDVKMLSDEWMDYHAESLFAENVLLDDVGAERPGNTYGVRFETVTDFLNRWQELALPYARLVLTTNLTSAELDARYGGRFYSRLKDHCVPLKLTGPDKRQWTLPRKRMTE